MTSTEREALRLVRDVHEQASWPTFWSSSVEDDVDLVATLRELLAFDGHTVRVAFNGEEGLRAMDERFPDLILLDVEMPVLDGPGTARELSRNEGEFVVCDQDRVVQVLSNLVSNALQFTPMGGTVLVDVSRVRQGVRFEVADTGVGMTEEELSHAFDRFWHGTAPGHGSGLGLWISKMLVQAQGGTIEAASEPGAGTRISFVIPQPVPRESANEASVGDAASALELQQSSMTLPH